MNYYYLRKGRIKEFIGKEIFEIQPVILGGSPEDIQNKVFLDRKQHIDAVRYWNKIIRELRQNI